MLSTLFLTISLAVTNGGGGDYAPNEDAASPTLHSLCVRNCSTGWDALIKARDADEKAKRPTASIETINDWYWDCEGNCNRFKPKTS